MNATDWSRFRVDRISWPTFLKRNLIHSDLLVEAGLRASAGVLEVGVGSGAQSAALSRMYRTVSVDNNARIIGAARPNLNRFGPAVELVAGDAFSLPFRDDAFGVALSQGLFEHFSDSAIIGLLQEQLRVARSAVFSVPSDHYPRQDVGDERLMSPAQWRSIIQAGFTGGIHIRARYYRFDPERWKYSARARRDLGGFNVLVTIDRT